MDSQLLFCVFNKISRANNLVESHNSRLGSKIHRNGNFFKFVEILLEEDSLKSREFSQIMTGGQQVYKRKGKATEMRNAKIRKLQTKLNSDDIGFVAFLNQITFFWK